jgi:PiT family inorganic phosphate transporter
MTGTAAARGRHTVHAATLIGILRGWVIGPGAGFVVAYGMTAIVTAITGAHSITAMR